jgi:hypothetical protein
MNAAKEGNMDTNGCSARLTRRKMLTCYECGYTSTDHTEFGLTNIEDPYYGMEDPYPGYEGDVVCNTCQR